MIRYCMKCLKFTNSNNIKIKREIDEKINLSSQCTDCIFIRFETIDRKELSDLLKTISKTMLSCCLKWRKNIGSKIPRMAKINEGKLILLLKCTMCDSKRSRFLKNQEASRLLSNLWIRTSLIEIPLLVNIMFQRYEIKDL